ncbi:MAG: sigma 54-interacting transcriptional regulator [Proteobacteria bacterium]|nr:sigma 54-interacting transcriptional regulator [Pseudomonadota bacterium]
MTSWKRRTTSEAAAVLETIILGRSSAIRDLREEIVALAAMPVRSVLVQGETGVGKELIPSALCAISPFLNSRVESFNCPAIPIDHLESELLGTTRGSYPGAVDRPGASERARGGVLFLDEISEMPLGHQSKVLRLLETGEGRRLGGTKRFTLDASVVAASNRSLAREVSSGTFREDLFYRLVQDGVLEVPPLRARREDIPILAEHFIAELGVDVSLAPSALECLCTYSWPGNVRELRAVLRFAARLEGGGAITADSVTRAIERLAMRAGENRSHHDAFFSGGIETKRELLASALQLAHGNQTLAGLSLGFHRGRHGEVTTQARKLAYRKFRYWWGRVMTEKPVNRLGAGAGDTATAIGASGFGESGGQITPTSIRRPSLCEVSS